MHCYAELFSQLIIGAYHANFSVKLILTFGPTVPSPGGPLGPEGPTGPWTPLRQDVRKFLL